MKLSGLTIKDNCPGSIYPDISRDRFQLRCMRLPFPGNMRCVRFFFIMGLINSIIGCTNSHLLMTIREMQSLWKTQKTKGANQQKRGDKREIFSWKKHLVDKPQHITRGRQSSNEKAFCSTYSLQLPPVSPFNSHTGQLGNVRPAVKWTALLVVMITLSYTVPGIKGVDWWCQAENSQYR